MASGGGQTVDGTQQSLQASNFLYPTAQELFKEF